MNIKITTGIAICLCSFICMAEDRSGGRGVEIIKGTMPEKPEFVEPEYAPAPEIEKVLPVIPIPPKEESRLPTAIKVYVKNIVLVGNKVFTDEALAPIVSPYENRTISIVELHELRHNISLYYFKNGYINSGAIIPDQEVKDGVITLQVIEGKLSEINLSGNRRLKPSYPIDRIKLGASPPLNISSLQESLSGLQQDPLIKKITADLQPGVQRGESVLDVNIEEARPYHITIGANNERSPSVGGEQAYINATHLNLLGYGDSISAQYSYSDGLGDFAVSYVFPVSARGTTVQASYSRSKSDVVEEPFQLIGIETESENIEVSVRHPFIKTRSKTVFGSLGFEKKHNETSLLGQPFSFSPGVQNGESDVSVLRFGVDRIMRAQHTALSLGAAIRAGVDVLDPTINVDAPDGKFLSLQGQVQYARRFGFTDQQIIFRSFMQIAADELLPIEKFAVGGAGSVRGYRENQFVRDNGLVASLEYRRPLFKDPEKQKRYQLQLVPFVDYGRSWNKKEQLPDEKTENITSVGLGLIWQPSRSLYAELFWGHALNDVDSSGNDLQDDGIHFHISYKLF